MEWNIFFLMCIFIIRAGKCSTFHNPVVIGGVPLGSSSSFLKSWKPTFERYLLDTVGQAYDPPLNFSLIPLTLSNAFEMVKGGKVHFVYSNPSLYSCLESEYSGTQLRELFMLKSFDVLNSQCCQPFCYSPCNHYTQKQGWRWRLALFRRNFLHESGKFSDQRDT